MRDIRERIYSAVMEAIGDTETISEEELQIKLEYLINISKILENYEQLRPTLMKYFSEEIRRKKFEMSTYKQSIDNESQEQLNALTNLQSSNDTMSRRNTEFWER